MSDNRLDGGAATQLAFDMFGDAPPLAQDVNLEAMIGRGVVAAAAAVGDDADKIDANLRVNLRNDGLQRVAIIRIACAALSISDSTRASSDD